MKTQSTQQTRWKVWGNILLPLLIALIFLAFVFSYYPFREKLQFDSDEGLNLMRSMLVRLGYSLYTEVSSDQPPLFTHLLSILFRVTGFEVNPARMLVLLFSTLLVWAYAQFLQITWGKVAAIFFLPLVVLVPQYLRLSTSVMIGLPSIALAAVAMLFVAVWHRKKNDVWLILSGCMLALSVLIKLFTGFVAPIFLIGITLAAYFDEGKNRLSWKLLRPALIWSLSFASLALVLGLALVGPQNIAAITAPHMAAPITEELEGPGYTMNSHLQAAVPLLLLGGMGALVAVSRRNWLSLYPLAWAALAYVLFRFYSPVFYHHQLLITLPVTVMAAAAVAEGVLLLGRLRTRSDLLQVQTALGVGALIGPFVGHRLAGFRHRHLYRDDLAAGLGLDAQNFPAAGVHVADDVSHALVGNGDLHVHDRLQQRRPRLRHAFLERANSFWELVADLCAQLLDPMPHRFLRRSVQTRNFLVVQLSRELKWRHLGRMENLVGKPVSNSVEQPRIRQRSFQRVRLGLEPCLEVGEIGGQHVEPPGIVVRQRGFALDHVQRRAVLGARLGEQQRARGEVERREPHFRRRLRSSGPPFEAARDHQVEDEEDLPLHLPHDALPQAPQPHDPAALGGRECRIDGAQQRRADDTRALEGLAHDTGRQRLEVNRDVGEFGHMQKVTGSGTRCRV